MKCPRCLNEDPSWFYHGVNGWYCRKCISFGRVMIEEENEPVSLSEIDEGSEEYVLKYPLTPAQKKVSDLCCEKIHEQDVLIHAVCGAGKTEIVMKTIADYLSRGERVCFAIARRQVVLEVAERLSGYFQNAKVIPVCGGHTDVTDGDLIVCTTHQLYRYADVFDLLILDEPDAFPFRNNPVLHGIAETSCHGHIIYLTATPDETMWKRIREGSLVHLTLNKRPHGHPIIVPQVITAPRLILQILLLRWLIENSDRPRIVFVPSIVMAEKTRRILSLFLSCSVCTSKTENRDEVIENFRKEKAGIIIATTVLERGVTIPHADVCVYNADSRVFDEAGLIQMAGRAGRDFNDPEGEVLFLCTEKSDLCMHCVRTIEVANNA